MNFVPILSMVGKYTVNLYFVCQLMCERMSCTLIPMTRLTTISQEMHSCIHWSQNISPIIVVYNIYTNMWLWICDWCQLFKLGISLQQQFHQNLTTCTKYFHQLCNYAYIHVMIAYVYHIVCSWCNPFIYGATYIIIQIIVYA